MTQTLRGSKLISGGSIGGPEWHFNWSRLTFALLLVSQPQVRLDRKEKLPDYIAEPQGTTVSYRGTISHVELRRRKWARECRNSWNKIPSDADLQSRTQSGAYMDKCLNNKIFLFSYRELRFTYTYNTVNISITNCF